MPCCGGAFSLRYDVTGRLVNKRVMADKMSTPARNIQPSKETAKVKMIGISM
jgi:hypothetical protein